MSKIIVVDAMCGKGKTSFAIQNLIENNWLHKDKFIYITPYLEEVDRIMSECSTKLTEAYTPDVINGKGSKTSHLKELLAEGKNIVTTHALFDRFDEECLDLLTSQDYTLYLDECHEVIKQHTLSQNDLYLLKTGGYIKVEESTGRVIWIKDNYDGRFEEFRNLCNLGAMYIYADTVFIWCFPVSIFNAMKKTYILTYLFEGQLQSYYYKLHGITYEKKYVIKDNNYYKLTEFKKEYEKEDIKIIISKINLYEGKLNYDKGITLTSTWFRKTDKSILKVIKNNVLNYFKHKVKGKSETNMWTTLKEFKKDLRSKGYSKGFVELNARATNQYIHKKNLAYVYNRYLNPIEKGFFNEHNIKVDEELFAVADLVQWIFRSAIRTGENINLYLPSKRMREEIYKRFIKMGGDMDEEIKDNERSL